MKHAKASHKLWVVSANRDHVLIERTSDSHGTRVSWDTLRAAATQDDAELRTEYGRALAVAERMRDERDRVALTQAPLVVCYGQDSTNVWWVTWVETECGLRVGRTWRTMTIMAQDEGMTQAHRWMVQSEARDIAVRILKIAPKHSVSIREVRT